MSFIYVASPYTHPDPKVRAQRYVQASYYVVALLKTNQIPYSPIVATHHLTLEFALPSKAIDWMTYNFAMLNSASELHVLTLPGWKESLGVQAEISFWRALDRSPVKLINLSGGELSCEHAPKDG